MAARVNETAALIHKRMCEDDRFGYSWEERHGASKETWRLTKAMELTIERRPDLIDEDKMTKEERKIYLELMSKKSLQQGTDMV